MEAKKRLLWKFRGGWLSILETGLEGDGLEQGFPGNLSVVANTEYHL